jgi:xylan 1,4-beta-xylosidase
MYVHGGASNEQGQWLQADLQHECDVHAIQINFADDQLNFSIPEGVVLQGHAPCLRYIDERKHYTCWLLEGSLDGDEYFVIEDKSGTETDLPHDLIVKEEGIRARYIRCTVLELPYNQPAAISGLRVFGIGEVEMPKQATGVQTELVSELDLLVTWQVEQALGSNVLWGFAPDKLYHSHMVFDSNEVTIRALIKGQPVYVRVDTFNEKGITEGEVLQAIG